MYENRFTLSEAYCTKMGSLFLMTLRSMDNSFTHDMESCRDVKGDNLAMVVSNGIRKTFKEHLKMVNRSLSLADECFGIG